MIQPPMIWRPIKGPLRVKLPYQGSHRGWLTGVLGRRPTHLGDGVWQVPRTKFRILCRVAVERFGEVTVVADFKASARCDTRCAEAIGDECVCACLGENHGGGLWSGWKQVGETMLVASRVQRVIYRRVSGAPAIPGQNESALEVVA